MPVGKSKKAGKICVKVKLSGWLASYFPANEMELLTDQKLDRALSELVAGVMARALTPVPQGGLMITINGKNVNQLDRSSYLLEEQDVVTLIPVVAGG